MLSKGADGKLAERERERERGRERDKGREGGDRDMDVTKAKRGKRVTRKMD